MYEFPCPDPVRVDLRVSGGTCHLRAEERDTATVAVEPYDTSDASEEAARDTKVELSGDTLVITAPETGGWLRRRVPRIRVTVAVPTGSSGRLRVASADLACEGQWADLKLNTASGDVTVDHTTADLTVNTASGNVRADQVGGRLTVNTASGDISVRHVAGPVEIKGASADIEIGELGDGLRSHTASGDVRIGAAGKGSIAITAASGDVSIGVLAGTGVWMDLNTLSGRTRSDLDVQSDATPTGHQLSLQVRTASGDIAVRRVSTP